MSYDIKRRIFDRCVEEDGPLDTPCLVWTGLKHKGYGVTWYQGKNWRVHRLVYELCVEPIPPGMQVNHECFQPDCVRLEHMKLGTHQTNMDDMVRHGRSLPGEAHPLATLKREQVVEILKMINEGQNFISISRCLGVSRDAIVDIAYGRTYQDVPGPRLTPPPPRSRNRFLGVYYNKGKGKWQTTLSINGKTRCLGHFGWEILAACCVNAHIAYLGLNKPLNVIDPEEWNAVGIYD